jgi:DNA-binding GntR family transcriptional regulator
MLLSVLQCGSLRGYLAIKSPTSSVYPQREELVAEHRDLLEALREGSDESLQLIEQHFNEAIERLRTMSET